MKPTPAKPRSSIAHVEGSGTPGTEVTGVKVVPDEPPSTFCWDSPVPLLNDGPAPNAKLHSPSNGGMLLEPVEVASKFAKVMAPAVTVKAFDVTKQALLPQIVLNGRESTVKTGDETVSMMTAVAADVALFVRPSISPVTVQEPKLQPAVNEKSKVKGVALPGDGNKPNKAMMAMRLNNFVFMITKPPQNPTDLPEDAFSI